MDMWDFRMFVRECLKFGQADEIIKILIEENILPPIPQGEWIDYSDEGYVECPFCGQATTCEDNKDELHYCWNCGAKMGGGAE